MSKGRKTLTSLQTSIGVQVQKARRNVGKAWRQVEEAKLQLRKTKRL